MTRKNRIPADVSPVFARGQTARPRVQAPDSPWTVWVGVGGAVVLGVFVFNGLSAGREARAQTNQPAPAAPAAQPAASAQPVPAPSVAAPAPVVLQSVAPAIDPETAHWRAPAIVVDFSSPEGVQMAQAVQNPTPGAAPGPIIAREPTDPRQSADERFSARVTSGLGDVARAGQMRDLGRTVPQGTVVAAVLETAINSDLPGSVRGIVSRDVRSFDGSRVLIPRGSKLIGQYRSAAAAGATRAFVVWERIITPAGVTIEVGSPATDRLGRGGLGGEVDRHFLQRFGASILLSVLPALTTALVSDGSGNNTTLVIGSAGQATQVANQALQQQMSIPDTIRVAQGVPVQVFVARDLYFGSVVQ